MDVAQFAKVMGHPIAPTRFNDLQVAALIAHKTAKFYDPSIGKVLISLNHLPPEVLMVVNPYQLHKYLLACEGLPTHNVPFNSTVYLS
jgi:hypothetical protein